MSKSSPLKSKQKSKQKYEKKNKKTKKSGGKNKVFTISPRHRLSLFLSSRPEDDTKHILTVLKYRSIGKLIDERPRRLPDPDQLAATSEGASFFMNPDSVYEFMLKGFSTITSNGSGVVNSFAQFDPSSAGYNFSEYSDLAALFSQIRLKHVNIQVLSSNWNQSASPVEMVVTAGAVNPTAQGAPGSLGAVITLADGRFINGQMSSASGTNFSLAFSGNSWSPTSTVVVTPYAGCPGSFQLYGGVFPVTTQVAYLRVAFTYQFRARS